MTPVHIPNTNSNVFADITVGEITEDFTGWMEEYVGSRGMDLNSRPDWYLDPRSHAVLSLNKLVVYYTIWIKDPNHLMLMKLTWGGGHW